MIGLRFASIVLALSALVSPPQRGTSDTGAPEAHFVRGSSGPMLLVAHGATAQEANERLGIPPEPHALADEERASAIALAAMPDGDLDRLSAALDSLNLRLEVRRNPFGDDLEDGEPTDELMNLVKTASSTLSAASALSSRRIASGDRRTVVALASTCGGAATECFPAWSSPGTSSAHAGAGAARATAPRDEERRARFFSWSVSLSATLAFDDPAALRRAVAGLRRASGDRSAGATIALVLSGDDLGGRAGERGRAVREKARKASALLNSAPGGAAKTPTLLRVLAYEPPPDQPLIPWLTVDSREVVVVPRLGALANLAGFSEEVARIVGDTGTRPAWVHRPAAP